MGSLNSKTETLSTFFPFLENAEPEITSMKAGSEVFMEGQSCGRVGFILSGLIRVYKLSDTGRTLNLYRIGKGESCILSMSCALSNPIHQASAVVEHDAVVATLSTNEFKTLIDKSSEAREYIFNLFAGRLSDVMVLMDEIVFKRVDQRLAEQLLYMSTKFDFTITTTHEKLSTELGTAREVVSRLLKDFEKKDIVRLRRGKIDIINRSELINLSGGNR